MVDVLNIELDNEIEQAMAKYGDESLQNSNVQVENSK
jgi:hypothetical protein